MNQINKIPYTEFKATALASRYLQEALNSGRIQGDGAFSKRCEALLYEHTNAKKVILTSSGTDALEMAGILANIGPGDEVIMPSFTFVSSANSIVLRGAKPVFVDIDPKTLNIDPVAIERSVTNRTKAIMPVHYAGVACAMQSIAEVASNHHLKVIEDAAHGVGSSWQGRALGAIGDFGAYSFHETKNITCGEGGALLINDPSAIDRAEVVRDKGTNRKKFMRGEIDRYTWVDVGSSFLPSELQAALLASQLEDMVAINGKRIAIWEAYFTGLMDLEQRGHLRRPFVPSDCKHNGHIFWIVLRSKLERDQLRQYLAENGIQATSHYECLHLAPIAGTSAACDPAGLPVTEQIVPTLLRLPLFPHLPPESVAKVLDSVHAYFKQS